MLFIVTSVWANIIPFSDIYSLQSGYSVAWFIFLYSYAGYCKLYGSVFKELKRKQYLIIYIIAVCFMVITYVVINSISSRIPALEEYDGISTLFTRYCSIPNFIGAAAMFHAFIGINTRTHGFQRIIGFFSPLTFGVYLIHDNPHMRNIVWLNIFKTNTIQDTWLTIPLMLGTVISCFVCCALLEFVRKSVFNLWEMNPKYNALIDKAQRKLSNLLDVGK